MSCFNKFLGYIPAKKFSKSKYRQLYYDIIRRKTRVMYFYILLCYFMASVVISLIVKPTANPFLFGAIKVGYLSLLISSGAILLLLFIAYIIDLIRKRSPNKNDNKRLIYSYMKGSCLFFLYTFINILITIYYIFSVFLIIYFPQQIELHIKWSLYISHLFITLISCFHCYFFYLNATPLSRRKKIRRKIKGVIPKVKGIIQQLAEMIPPITGIVPRVKGIIQRHTIICPLSLAISLILMVTTGPNYKELFWIFVITRQSNYNFTPLFWNLTNIGIVILLFIPIFIQIRPLKYSQINALEIAKNKYKNEINIKRGSCPGGRTCLDIDSFEVQLSRQRRLFSKYNKLLFDLTVSSPFQRYEWRVGFTLTIIGLALNFLKIIIP